MGLKPRAVPRESLPGEVEQILWRMILPWDHKLSPAREWQHWKECVAYAEWVEGQHPGHQLTRHKLLNTLSEALTLAAKHPEVAPVAERLDMAALAVASLPSRFNKNSPFGAACLAAWESAHETLAELHPSRSPEWEQRLASFRAAARPATNAPRSHSEGSLLSAKAHGDLIETGRSMPWYPLALELAATRSRG